MKRLVEVVVALVGLTLFLPVGCVIAVILRCTGERQVFYAQPRVGLGGRMFPLHKFVTMIKNSESMGSRTITLKNDRRVLPVGRFLRKTKLNEVPQLWNILAGEMGLVGPRPMTSEDFARYPAEVARQIVSVKPGLTGLGSIVFRDEESVIARSSRSWLECYEQEITPYKGELELWYIKHQNPWLDLKLVLLTAWVVIVPGSRVHRALLGDIPRPPRSWSEPSRDPTVEEQARPAVQP